ncbi:MAG: BrnA antitoxin family protein [Desulfuromonadales bacterium]
MKTEYDFTKGTRGAVVPTEKGKTRVTIRLDDDVLEWFKTKVDEQGGGNYQTMINSVLRSHIKQDRPITELLREVLREEFKFAA